MSTKYFALTDASLCIILAACGSPATQGMTDGVTEGATTDTTPTGPTTALAPTGPTDSEGSGSETDTAPPTTEAPTSTTTLTTSTTDSTATDSTATDSTVTDGTTTASATDSTTGEPVGCGDSLVAVIRDFKVSHPDMESYCCGQVSGLVQPTLGPDKKPVFQSVGAPQMLTDAPTFAQWYTDIADVNQKTEVVLELTEIQPGLYSYTNNSFFPVDDALWGNEGNPHNFHFTTVHDTS